MTAQAQIAEDFRTRIEARLNRATLLLLNTVAQGYETRALEEVIQSSSSSQVMAFLNLDDRFQQVARGAGLSTDQDSFAEAIRFAYEQGGRQALDALDSAKVAKALPTVGASMAFDLINPSTIEFLQGYVFNLIREMSADSRLAIGQVILRGFNEGLAPREQALEIKQMIGLTQRQTQAVLNYRKGLESGNTSELRQTLDRVLRDGRYDATVLRAIKEGGKIPKERIDAMVARYRERLLRHRAMTIARTETIRASMAGQHETWDQAIAQGYIDPQKTRRRWDVASDERVCPVCKPIPKLNPKGVGFNERFKTPVGPVIGPPAHVTCRCAVSLLFL